MGIDKRVKILRYSSKMRGDAGGEVTGWILCVAQKNRARKRCKCGSGVCLAGCTSWIKKKS